MWSGCRSPRAGVIQEHAKTSRTEYRDRPDHARSENIPMSVATPDRPALETYRFDLGREEVFRLEEAASRLPSRRSGRPVSRNALYGWTKGGIKANDGT